ncbi:MAG TPA: M10 family metallopeptidase [Beijerinckiaceae bacterium]|jgi:serralysin|nr:M10 family metallopeptidase [Beijerinckiaceae bacterium]
MPAVSAFNPTGKPSIDGLLGGTKWAVASLTFSFPALASHYGPDYGDGETTDNFGALNPTQQAAARAALAMYAAVSNLSFSEVAESATRHGDLRYARSDAPSTAWAYFPSPWPEGGDVWFNNSLGRYDNPVRGNYAWHTGLHETGHALGLKHPHEPDGAFGAMPIDRDSVEYTVMSYRSHVGDSTAGGYVNGSWDFPQTLMMDDIRAIQEMYGPNYGTNAGDTVYQWSPTTGELSIDGAPQGSPGANRIFLTVWDGGGVDTYDFSSYAAALTISLEPAAWSTASAAQLARLDQALGGTRVAAGNIANSHLFNGDARSLIENAKGGSAADRIAGNDGANALWGMAGSDTLLGGAGDDTLRGRRRRSPRGRRRHRCGGLSRRFRRVRVARQRRRHLDPHRPQDEPARRHRPPRRHGGPALRRPHHRP